MKTRTIPELLQVLLDNEEYFISGLCSLSSELCFLSKISQDEEANLYDYIYSNPTPYSFHSSHHFPIGEWPPRKEWLEKQIEYSKNFES